MNQLQAYLVEVWFRLPEVQRLRSPLIQIARGVNISPQVAMAQLQKLEKAGRIKLVYNNKPTLSSQPHDRLEAVHPATPPKTPPPTRRKRKRR